MSVGTELSLMGDSYKEGNYNTMPYALGCRTPSPNRGSWGKESLQGLQQRLPREVPVEICLIHKDLVGGFEKSQHVAGYGDTCLLFQILWSL